MLNLDLQALYTAAIAGLPGWAALIWQAARGPGQSAAPEGGGDHPGHKEECPEVICVCPEVVCPRPECPETDCPIVECPSVPDPRELYPLLEEGLFAFLFVPLLIATAAGVLLGRWCARRALSQKEAGGQQVIPPVTDERRRQLAAEQVAAVRARREAVRHTQQ
ncbi:unnamed protein product [Prorocentrum cordatum]|uniref:Uncharacterized protein n=1 Tax=Prorocentrum cordatum TaxID=2364126 RepID=A0ABN9TC98_9DINO|nr:unnamed protein product [Polarella glacialis]